MYCDVVPVYHAESLRQFPQLSALAFNNFFFLAHECLTLGLVKVLTSSLNERMEIEKKNINLNQKMANINIKQILENIIGVLQISREPMRVMFLALNFKFTIKDYHELQLFYT